MSARAELLRDRAGFVAEWREIFSRTPNATMFQTPTWLKAWLVELPVDHSPYGVRVHAGEGGLVALGVAVLAPRRAPWRLRETRFSETGDPVLDAIYVEYNDLLIAADAPPDVREQGLAALVDALPEADEFIFKNAAPSLVAAAAAITNERELRVEAIAALPTYRISLLGHAPATAGFSASLRTKINRAIGLYEKRGPLSVDCASSPSDRADAWARLIRLHNETWARRGDPGAFSNARFRAFHETLLEDPASGAELVTIRAGEEAIGVLLNYVVGEVVYNYQSGFLYEADNQITPGFVAHALAAEHYRRKGCSAYDLMGGDADYKRRMGAPGDILETFSLVRSGWKRSLREAGRSLKAKMPGAAGTHRTLGRSTAPANNRRRRRDDGRAWRRSAAH